MNARLNYHDSSDALWHACVDRDRAYDGRLIIGVRTTGIYCRPSCPARKPRRENVLFFAAAELARQVGFRACKRCRPDREMLRDPAAERALSICHYIRSAIDEPVTLARLGKRFSLSPAHLQRVFKQYVGLSPLERGAAVRMDQLKLALRQGASVTDAIYASGFSSSSRVYERAARAIGMTPRRYRERVSGTPSPRATSVDCWSHRPIRESAPCNSVMMPMHWDGCCTRSSVPPRSRDDDAHADWVRGLVAIAEGRAADVACRSTSAVPHFRCWCGAHCRRSRAAKHAATRRSRAASADPRPCVP
jgi:methylphosphotriester-DNA--protein-cysteine methyltransferase